MEDLTQKHLDPLLLGEPNRFPVNQGNASETSSDTLSGTESVLISASLGRPLRASSKVLIMATCQVNNDAIAAREITLKIRRGGSGTATDFVASFSVVQELQALAADKEVVTLTITDSPSTTTAATYGLWGTTDGGSPTATNKSISIIELPQVTKLPS